MLVRKLLTVILILISIWSPALATSSYCCVQTLVLTKVRFGMLYQLAAVNL